MKRVGRLLIDAILKMWPDMIPDVAFDYACLTMGDKDINEVVFHGGPYDGLGGTVSGFGRWVHCPNLGVYRRHKRDEPDVYWVGEHPTTTVGVVNGMWET